MENNNEVEYKPHPALFPYMIVRVMPAVYQQIFLVNAPLDELKRLVKEHPASRKLKTCLVLGPDSCIFFTPEGEEKEGTVIPKGGRLLEGPVDYDSIGDSAADAVGGLILVHKTQEPVDSDRIRVEGDGVYSNKMIHIEPSGKWLTVLKEGEGVNILSYAVVVKVKSIQEKYKGGWEEFLRFCKAHNYPIITDNCLASTYDGDVRELYVLLDSLVENGLQNNKRPVDFYLTDPSYEALAYSMWNDAREDKDFFCGKRAIGTCNDFEIEMFLIEGTEEEPGRIVARLRENNWNKHRNVFRKAINLYKQGDLVGSLFETGAVFHTNYTYEQIMKRSKSGRFRTDENDIVDCFLGFIKNYRYRSEKRLLLDWVVYHTEHRTHVKYGGTYREHFQTVGSLKHNKNLTVERLYEISEDKNSFGNACLALVYPVFHYAETLNFGMQDRHKLTIDFCRLTHLHSFARNAVTLLFLLIEVALRGGNIFDIAEYRKYEMFSAEAPDRTNSLEKAAADFFTAHIDLNPEDFMRTYPDNVKALNTLFYALYCVKRAWDVQDVITNVVNFAGDVDSVNALAMMIWGILDQESLRHWR